MFLVQLSLVATVILILLWRLPGPYRLQVVVWAAVNTLVFLKYGEIGQLDFYSNDQRHYYNITKSFTTGEISADVDWWFSSARVPYTMPAALLSTAGMHTVLALKSTSLLFLLGLTHLAKAYLSPKARGWSLASIYLTSLGPIGVFFSTLAQRETTMMFFTTVVFTAKSLPIRVLSLIALAFLRPHLCAAVLIAWVLLQLIKEARRIRTLDSPTFSVMALTVGSIIGYLAYSIGSQLQTGNPGLFGHRFGIGPLSRIASNFVGLQFLTANETSIQLSISELLLGRLLFPETIAIPTLFTVGFLLSKKMSFTSLWPMLSFAVYVGIVTNTDFNSFRQNVPLMPVMGFCVMNALQRWRALRISDDKARTLVETSD